jgi:hypothetical protein
LQDLQANTRSITANIEHMPLEPGLLAHWLQSITNAASRPAAYK